MMYIYIGQVLSFLFKIELFDMQGGLQNGFILFLRELTPHGSKTLRRSADRRTNLALRGYIPRRRRVALFSGLYYNR